MTAPDSRWHHILHSPGWMVLIGFIVRVLYIALAHSYKFRTTDANFSFGWEIGRIAYSLANGHGFSSPFGGDTGPSAWTAPVYPWIVSLAFRAFGNLHARRVVRAADLQQPVLRPNLLGDLPHRAPRVQRKSRRLVGLDLGAAALHHLLVGALDLGNQPHRAAVQPGLHADGRDGRRQPHHVVGRLRRALGRHRPHESLDAFISSLRRMLARLPALPPRASDSCSLPSSPPSSSG